MTIPKKILVLSPRFVYPVYGGDKLRIYQVCIQLAKHYSLTLLSLCESREDMEFTPPRDDVFDNIERVYLPKWKSYINALCAMPSRTPLQVSYYRSTEFKQKINKLLPAHDGVLAHLIRTGDYLHDYNGPKILEMTDAISLNYSRIKELGGPFDFKRSVFKLEANRVKDYEKRIVSTFNMVSLVSDTDRKFLFGNDFPRNLLVSSNGVDFERKSPIQAVRNSKIIVFIGNMGTVQNLDACCYFVNNILPKLRMYGDYVFRIVGVISDKKALEFRKITGVEVTGKVESIRNAVRGASSAVCPIRIGAGVQNKLLEYMAMGLPAITTTIGSEGINAIPGKHFLLADSPDEFIQSILSIEGSASKYNEIASAGRKFIEDHHAWDLVLSKFIEQAKEIYQ